MIRVLLDSIDPLNAIPRNWSGLVGTYCTGPNAIALATVKAAFPRAQGHVRINVDANPSYGNVLDVEHLDATPADLDGWLHERLNLGVPLDQLGAYCNRNTLPAILAATLLPIHHWVATLDGTLHIQGYPPLAGPAAVQALGAAAAGTNADLSIVFEDGWVII